MVAGLRSLAAALASRRPDVAHRHRRPTAMSTALHGSSEPPNAAHLPCPSAWILRALRRSRGGDTPTAPGLGSRANRLDPFVDVKKSVETKPSNSPGRLQIGSSDQPLRSGASAGATTGSSEAGSRRRESPFGVSPRGICRTSPCRAPARALPSGSSHRSSRRKVSPFSLRSHPFGDASVQGSQGPSRAETTFGFLMALGAHLLHLLRESGARSSQGPSYRCLRNHLAKASLRGRREPGVFRVLCQEQPREPFLSESTWVGVRLRAGSFPGGSSGGLCAASSFRSSLHTSQWVARPSRALSATSAASRNPRPRSRAEGGSTGQPVCEGRRRAHRPPNRHEELLVFAPREGPLVLTSSGSAAPHDNGYG